MISQIQDLVVTDVTSIPESNVIGFDYSRKSDVKVKLGAPGVSDANLVERTFTTEWTITSNNRVQLEASLFSGTGTGTYRLQIFRQTDASPPVHVFQPGSSVRAQELNAVNQQALHIAEEVRDTVNSIVLDGYSPSNVLIDTSKLAPNAITTDKIQNGQVKEDDIDTDAVTSSKIKDDEVTMAKLGSGALPSDITVSNANLVDNTVTPAKLSHTGVTAGSYNTADITVDEQGRITAAANGQIGNSELVDGAVSLAKISGVTQTLLMVPVGTVLSFAGTTALPTGYLLCDGATIPNGTGTVTQTVNGVTYNIFGNFANLYTIIGNTLPSMVDNRFVRYAAQGAKSQENESWKSFTIQTFASPSNYSHQVYMERQTAQFGPVGTPAWTAGNSGQQWAMRIQWDNNVIRPKNTVLLPMIKY